MGVFKNTLVELRDLFCYIKGAVMGEKYLITRNDLIQQKKCIKHVNIDAFMKGRKRFV